ncbi:MAG: 50S ribosomal protein L23 [Acidobacteriota bacterium]
MNPYDVIRCPVITEKATLLKEKEQTLCFEVDSRATALDVRRAVETVFKAKVAAVRVINVRGKRKRLGGFEGFAPNWKKAYVRLAPEQQMIEYFEGV